MLQIRNAEESDMAYVYDSFTRSMRDSVYCEGMSHRDVRELLARLLAGQTWLCTVMVDSQSPDTIIAYVVWKTTTDVAWLQVRGTFSGLGIGHKLLAQIGVSRGVINTPFIPSPAFSRTCRRHGWFLHHRPWMS